MTETTTPRQMRLVSFKPMVGNSLRGFATIELPLGLKIFDIPILASGSRVWAALPSKPQIDQDRRQKVDANGKSAYTPVLEWRDRELADKFSGRVVDLVRAEFPDALDGGLS